MNDLQATRREFGLRIGLRLQAPQPSGDTVYVAGANSHRPPYWLFSFEREWISLFLRRRRRHRPA